ncbi:MAG: hypothetical protein ACOYL6_16195 [Bacteriovoracaceae bacterium]
MKKLLIGLLICTSSAFANPFSIQAHVKPKIDAAYIRAELYSMWKEEGKPSYEQLEKSLNEKKNREYKGVATCVSLFNDDKEIFHAGIALGVIEKAHGPFKEDIISLDYLENSQSWIKLSESQVLSNLYKLGYNNFKNVNVKYIDDNDGVKFEFEGEQGAEPWFFVKPISNPRGLKNVSYLIQVNYQYLCIL